MALLVWFGALVAVGASGPVATVQAQPPPAAPYDIAIARDVMVTMRDGCAWRRTSTGPRGRERPWRVASR